VKKIILFIFF